ncbi:hypothetical protein [Nocardia jiangsuensis]|uniref:Uncharacterized protein n=1 Tax=Nocardia jiangsuensis TaxID=1691563 RepID=A0ABV8DSK8_9NOCA
MPIEMSSEVAFLLDLIGVPYSELGEDDVRALVRHLDVDAVRYRVRLLEELLGQVSALAGVVAALDFTGRGVGAESETGARQVAGALSPEERGAEGNRATHTPWRRPPRTPANVEAPAAGPRPRTPWRTHRTAPNVTVPSAHRSRPRDESG